MLESNLFRNFLFNCRGRRLKVNAMSFCQSWSMQIAIFLILTKLHQWHPSLHIHQIESDLIVNNYLIGWVCTAWILKFPKILLNLRQVC